MSQQTLQSRADSCGTLAAGAEAAARVGNVQLFRGMSQQELKSKLQVRVSTSENIYFLTIDCIYYISIYIHHVMMGYLIYMHASNHVALQETQALLAAVRMQRGGGQGTPVVVK
jgi:hypothetical protein